MATAEIRGLIFDMDGVIADTDELHYLTWQRLADEENIAFSREKYARMSGVGHVENAITFTEGLTVNEETIADWMRRKQEYYVELRDNITADAILPGIERIIEEAKSAGLAIAVGSSSRNARPVLEKLGLLHHFKVIGDGYSVKKLKPAPDVFLYVANELDIPPSNCLILEDASGGVEAALKAGCYVIGVGERPLDKAHAKVDSLADFSLEELLALI